MAGTHKHLLIHSHSPIHHIAPEAKIVATFFFAVGVALTPREAVWAFALDAVVIATLMAVAGYRPRQALVRFAAVLPFIAFALFIPFVAGGEQTSVLGVSLSVEGLWASWNVLAKATLGTGASLVLAGTTPIPEVVRGLGMLRMPPIVVSIVAFMFRYLDLIVEEMGRVRIAMTARGHDPRWLWQAKPIASAAGAMFVRSYERGERVHSAMLARGYTGTMPQLDHEPAAVRDWVRSLAVPVVPITLAILAAVAF
ncbi:MAG: cobalt ECF transporter T component CbiQ [Acidimicrobiales bacterium]